MLTSATIIAMIKTSGQVAVFGAALVNLLASERIRQYELVRELGTLECEIENAKIVGRDCSALQKWHDQLARLMNG